jgi:hypothetical protein
VWEKGEIEMGIKQALTRVLMNWLPADDQARMVADFIAWLYADLPPAGQQEKIEQLGPRLIEMIREGRFGLPLLIYYHLLRLPPLRWLDRWVTPVEAPAESQLAPLASRWP